MIKRYYNYLKCVFWHKYFVFVECCKMGMPLRGLMHDLSKLRPSELIPYARHFYKPNGDSIKIRDKTGYYKATDTGDVNFDYAWLRHFHRNPHHWQYWVTIEPNDIIETKEIPTKYIKEMVCDWKGASLAQGVGSDILPWYKVNKDKMLIHSKSREKIEKLIGYNGD